MHDGIFRCKSPPGVESLNVWRRLCASHREIRRGISWFSSGFGNAFGGNLHPILVMVCKPRMEKFTCEKSKVILLTSRRRQQERDHVTGHLMFSLMPLSLPPCRLEFSSCCSSIEGLLWQGLRDQLMRFDINLIHILFSVSVVFANFSQIEWSIFREGLKLHW